MDVRRTKVPHNPPPSLVMSGRLSAWFGGVGHIEVCIKLAELREDVHGWKSRAEPSAGIAETRGKG